jgi:hypothetical protein
MMDEAIKTHKETAFGWVLMVQQFRQHLAVKRAAGRAAAKARLAAIRDETLARPMRYLGLR